MNEEKLKEILESMRQLNPARLAGWGASRIPNAIDDEITDVINGYLELDDGGKRKVREGVERDQKFVFLAFAERMASLAIRQRSQEPLMMGMVAIFLQVGTGDVREDILILTLIHAAAQKLGIDPRSVFLESARKSGMHDTTSGLDAFLARSDEDKSIESMGYTEGVDSDGFRFLRLW
jgi:hypothetical protein